MRTPWLASLLLALAWVSLAEDPLPPPASPPRKNQKIRPETPVASLPVPCNVTDEDLEPIYSENLLEDFKLWPNKLTMDKLDAVTQMFQPRFPDVVRVLLIYNNSLYFPDQQTDSRFCGMQCNRYLQDVRSAFHHWLKEARFPNVVFLLSVWDAPHCQYAGHCPAPVLSIAKQIRPMPPPMDSVSWDILIPKAPRRATAYFHYFPWSSKAEMAAWRGTRWCDMGLPQHHVGCSRFYMGEWYKNSSEVRELVDFGYTAGWHETTAEPIKPQDFARYKFLLNLDGFTAAYRFSKLMLINSPILKEESGRGEYYYRSLKENVHYIPVFKDNATDLLDVIRAYQKPERQRDLMQIAKNAQEFSAKYCCPRARMLYWRRVLQEYKALFPDMDATIESKWWPKAKATLPPDALSG